MSDPQSLAPFSFDVAGNEASQSVPGDAPLDGLTRVTETASLDRIRRSIEAVGEAAYHWVVETDQIFWSSNVVEVLGCEPDAVKSGRAYANLLDTDNFTSRYDTVMRAQTSDDGGGVPFQIEYLFRPDGRTGRRAVWLEDNGKWFGGKNGRPAEVFGTVRRIDERHKRDQHLSFLGNCDPLTGMMNRGRMAEALGEAMSVAEREHRSCALVLAAINNLSVVNEAYGFEVADEVIVAMGRRLRQIVRTGDAIARYSGSKFGIILNSCSDDELMVAAERFLGARAKASSKPNAAPSGRCCLSARSSCRAMRPTRKPQWRARKRL
ncbi:MAG: sensor domain-containing diguanylate cyclase [Rhizobiales bacterium]|nr:sensor domain-containing diguanylate cyclase [Hyphomicrobiales bacterium]